jgi:hypothetical protein
LRLITTFLKTERIRQGIEGPVVLTGSTPELDEFTIRIVDGAFLLFTTTGCAFRNECLQVRTTKRFLVVRSQMFSPTA